MGKHIKQTPKEVWKHQRFIIDDFFYSDNTYDWNAGLKILLPCIETAHKSYMNNNQEAINRATEYKDMLVWALRGDPRINKTIVRKLAHGLRGGIQHNNVLEGGITITNEMRDGDVVESCISKDKDGNVILILWSFWEWVLINIDLFYGFTDKSIQLKHYISTLDSEKMTSQQLLVAVSIASGLPIDLTRNSKQDLKKIMQKFRKDAMDEGFSARSDLFSATSDLMDSHDSKRDNH